MNKPLFIGHGSPMNAVQNNDYSNFLNNFAKSINKPEAIAVISAHWQTKGTFITGSSRPEQIYDFYGFPLELYEIKYRPKGNREAAEEIKNIIPEIEIDYNRGIDHAGWAVVKHMYPDQDVPLLEISLDVNKNESGHFDLGRKLAALSKSILFIGSGNLVHNLSDISFNEKDGVFPWAKDADAWIDDRIKSENIDELINYRRYMPDCRRAIPTNEHYLPFLYILGMKTANKGIETIYQEIQNGSISMRSIRVELL